MRVSPPATYIDTLIPGSRRVVVTEQVFITIRCGQCGAHHQVQLDIWTPRTKRCTVCRRIMQVAGATELPPNVVPFRRAS